MASLGLNITRGIFSAIEAISPPLAAQAAFELFQRTPNPARVSEREKRLNTAGRLFMERARRHDLRTPHGCVAAYEFRQQGRRGPAVLVLHGWASRSEHMMPLVSELTARRVRVVALDLPGHGASAGRRLNMATAVAGVAATEQWLGPFSTMVGHSFGGAVALNAVAGSIAGIEPVPARSLALVSSPSSIPGVFEDFARFLRLGSATQMALADRVATIAGRPLADFVGAEQLAALGLPTLVVHAPDDKEVPFAEALAFEKAGPHVRLVRLPGLGHRRILGDTQLALAVADFVETAAVSPAAAPRPAADRAA